MATENIEIQMWLDLSTFEKDIKKAEKSVMDFVKKVESKWAINLKVNKNFVKDVEQNLQTVQRKVKETQIETWIRLSLDEYKKTLTQADLIARDTNKKLEPELRFKLQMNILELEDKVEQAKKQLKNFSWTLKEEQKLRLDIQNYKSNLTEARREFRNFINTGEKDLSRFSNVIQANVWGVIWTIKNKFSQLSDSVSNLGDRLKETYQKILSLSSIATVLSQIQNWIDYFAKPFQSQESAFAWVKKTIDTTAEWYKELNNELKNLARQIPLTYEELASIAEVWGQMWIWKEDIIEFTTVVAKLWTAISWISREEAAQVLARILSATGEGIWNIEKLSDSLVVLGNNFKANEWEILNFANRIISAWDVVWLTWDEILAISTTFVDLWIQAEAGWSSVSKGILKINQAVADGWIELEKFAQISWMTAEEFKRLWEEDAWEAFLKFVEWLWTTGNDMSKIISDLLWNSSELQRTFLSVWQNSEILKNAMDKVKQSSKDLEQEFSKRLETVDSKLQINSNKWELWKGKIWETFADIKLWLSSFFVKYIPQMLAGFQMIIHKISYGLSNAIDVFKLFLLWVTTWVINLLSWFIGFFSNFWDNIFAIVENIWVAFKNIWYHLWTALQDAFNTAKNWVNSFTWLMRSIPLIWEKIANNLEIWDFTFANWLKKGEYKSLNYKSAFVDSANKSFKEEVKSIRELQKYKEKYHEDVIQKLSEQWNTEALTSKAIKKVKDEIKKENNWWKWNSYIGWDLDDDKNWRKGGGWGKKDKSTKELKEQIDEEIKEIKRRYQAEIDEIDKLNLKEEEKAKKKKELYDKAEKEIDKLKKDRFEIEKEENEKLIELQEKKYKEDKQNIEKWKNIAQKYYDELIDKAQKYQDELKKISEKIQNVNEKMQEALDKRTTKLWDRYFKIEDELKKLQDQKKALEDKWASFYSESFRKSDIKTNEKFATDKWKISWSDLKKYQELIEKENKLLKEKERLNWNDKYWNKLLSETDLQKAKERAEMLETEKILAEFEQTKEKLQKELDEYKKQEEEKQKLYDETIKQKESAEKLFTSFIREQTWERIWEMEKMRDRAIEIAREMAELWFTWQWFKATFVQKQADGSTREVTRTINYWDINQNYYISKDMSKKDIERTVTNWTLDAQRWMSNLEIKK